MENQPQRDLHKVKVETYRAKCTKCGAKFSYPWLGDFAYGSFLFTGEKGGVFGYANASDSSAWDFLTAVLIKTGADRQADLDYGQRIQAAYAHFADHIQGQRLCHHDVCPSCQSSQIDLWPTEVAGSIEVADVTHTNFMTTPESVRRQNVLDFDHA